jgi:hypothetical protein
MWVDEHNQLPEVLDDAGESAQSFVGRGYLYANKDVGAIGINSSAKKATPRRTPNSIINDMEAMEYVYNDTDGWISKEDIEKNNAAIQKTATDTEKNTAAAKKEKDAKTADEEKNKATIAAQELANKKAGEDRLLNANYNVLNADQKKQYDDLLMSKSALAAAGLSEWPKDTGEQNRIKKEFRKNHKRVIDPVSNKKVWLQRNADMGAYLKDESPIKRGLKNVMGKLGKGAFAGLAGLGAAIWAVGKDMSKSPRT